MTCKPTVGEVREHDGKRCRVETVHELSWFSNWFIHPIDYPSRIVEVAPVNQARVTAGPKWMSAR